MQLHVIKTPVVTIISNALISKRSEILGGYILSESMDTVIHEYICVHIYSYN